MVGQARCRKNLGLFLRALTFLQDRSRLKVDILGQGPETTHWQSYAERNGLSNQITWHGQVARDKAVQIMSGAHLHVLTSLMEANTTVLFEAMSYGIPTVSLDHCGMRDTICADCGIKISVESYDVAAQELAEALRKVIAEPAWLRKLGQGALRCAQRFTWVQRIQIINQIYEEAVQSYQKRSGNKI